MEIEDEKLAELIQAKTKINGELDKIAAKAQITPA
jgi:hypothetical protein